MKIRIIIAIILGLAVFAGLVVAFGSTAMYCDQQFPNDNIPLVCPQTRPDISPMAKAVINIGGWLVLIGLPTLTTMLYAKFGWPRRSGTKVTP